LIDNHNLFLLIAFFGKTMGGIGAGLNATTSIAILTSHYKEDRETIMGYIEGASGLGALIGPIIGSGLYALIGYCGPFYVLAILNLIIYFAMVVPTLKTVSMKEEDLVGVDETSAV
jgi:MFS family permease